MTLRRGALADAAREEAPAPAAAGGDVATRLQRARAGGPERHRRKVAEQGKLMASVSSRNAFPATES